MKLVERGTADGKGELPPDFGGERASAEQEIESEMESERTRLTHDLTTGLRAYREHLAQLETAMDIARVRQGADSALARFQEVSSQWAGEMARLRRRAVDYRDEFERFRRSHDLIRPARQPVQRAMTVAWLPTMITVESVFNGVFFAEGSNLGLIGGILTAITLSLINVTFGFLLGWGPARWMNRRRWLLRLPAAIVTIGGAVVILGFNVWVGHYRDAYETMGDAVSLPAVWQATVANPVGFVALASWLLLLMGCFFAGVGAWKGYRFDDPYPQYGAYDRRRHDAEHEYAVNRQLFLGETSAIRDECLGQLETTMSKLRGAATLHKQTLSASTRVRADAEAHEHALERAGAQLVAIYRDANRKARATPSPLFFAEPFRFHDRVLERALVRQLSGDPSPHPDAGALLAELGGLRGKMLTAYSAMLNAAPPAEL